VIEREGTLARSAAEWRCGSIEREGTLDGAKLRAAGLTPRALVAWAGTDRLSALAARIPELAARPMTPASTALAEHVAGVGAHDDCAILPLGPSLLVCDRPSDDAARAIDRVCWPDDSSYHLAHALPAGRRARWLDLGCGSAFAPLFRPELAAEIDAVDVNPRAVAYARRGARLSGIAHLAAHTADLADAPPGPYDLVTCNAPIPAARDAALWHRADAELFARLWRTATARVAPRGMVVVHGVLAELRGAPPVGERVIVAYTPEGAAAEFGVLWWRPDAAARCVDRRRELTADRPHVDARDRDDALAE